MPPEAGFDLIDRPWVATRTGQQVQERSLTEVFEQAHEITALAGELPTQEVAVLRLLLVILRRSLPPVGTEEEALDQWGELWRAPALPADRVQAYLEEHRDRFDLFHPQTPFLQVAGLQTKATSGVGKIIAEVPDGTPYFTTRAGRSVASLSPAEAARWVLHCQAFDPSGIKSGAVGDPRVKGGKGYPIGTGWAGRCGLVVVEGATLKETLLLNLPIERPDPRDLPVWERAPLTAAPEAGHEHPVGPNDIMTWPARRLRLAVEGDRVSGVVVANGDPIQRFNQHEREPMSAWRYSEPQTKKNGFVSYMGREHDPNRSFWRGLTSLLARTERTTATGNDPARTLPPRTVEWIARLQRDEVLPMDIPVRVRAVGMVYGSNDSVVDTVVDDALRLRLSVLTDPVLQGDVTAGLECAEQAVQAVGALARDLALAQGALPEGPRDTARARAYVELDTGFRRWVAGLSTGTDDEAALRSWQEFVHATLRRLGARMVDEAGDSAWRGRVEEDQKGVPRRKDAAGAAGRFAHRLAEVLPLARPAVTAPGTPTTEGAAPDGE